MKQISSLEIANYLNSEHFGGQIKIIQPCSLNNIKPQSVTFAKVFRKTIANFLNQQHCIFAIVCPEYAGHLVCSYVISTNPRLAFAQVLSNFFQTARKPFISNSAQIGENPHIGNNVIIGHNTMIGDNVTIGDNTEIRHNVVIGDNSIIGSNCLIKSNAIIGEEGFGFAFDEDHVPFRLPHLGNVVIEDNVEIGCFTTVCRGTIDSTYIHSNCKIDDHVHIPHNVTIGTRTIITSGVIISGSTKIGKDCWLAPNCSINNSLTIGDNVTIGTGSVVLRNVDDNATVLGNPGKKIR